MKIDQRMAGCGARAAPSGQPRELGGLDPAQLTDVNKRNGYCDSQRDEHRGPASRAMNRIVAFLIATTTTLAACGDSSEKAKPDGRPSNQLDPVKCTAF